jgi:uncharacterized protein (TIGR02757 family)
VTDPTAALAGVLEAAHAEFHHARFLGSDPLAFARRYDDAADREVVALLAACMAFGNVKAIHGALEVVLSPLGPHPAAAVAARQPADWSRTYRAFQYRWVTAADLRHFLATVGAVIRTEGTLGALWARLDDPAEPDTVAALGRWVAAILATRIGGPAPRKRLLRRADGTTTTLPTGARMLLPEPARGSACKRLHLFLRWVVRPDDGIDLGLWPVSPARLVMPIDTHVLQAAHALGLTARPTADLATAREITAALRAVDPADPCRFDFSLTRPGILRLREWMVERGVRR